MGDSGEAIGAMGMTAIGEGLFVALASSDCVTPTRSLSAILARFKLSIAASNGWRPALTQRPGAQPPERNDNVVGSRSLWGAPRYAQNPEAPCPDMRRFSSVWSLDVVGRGAAILALAHALHAVAHFVVGALHATIDVVWARCGEIGVDAVGGRSQLKRLTPSGVGRTMMVGAFALAPLVVTAWAVWALVQIGSTVGSIVALPLMTWLRRQAPELAATLATPWIETTLELAATAALLWAVGMMAGSVIGNAIGGYIIGVAQRVPIANIIYGSVQKLVQSFTAPATTSNRIVLIEFPSSDVKAVGFVTRQFTDSATGETLLAVYVPTTPNPTSGYVEIVPEERVVWLDWTAQEATQFIISGGVAGPSRIQFGAKQSRAADRNSE